MSSWKGRLEILSLWILLTLSFTIGKPLKKVHWEFPDSSAEDPWLSSEEGSHLHNVTLYTQTVTMDDWEENSAVLFNITLYSNVHWCPKANCLELYCHLQRINLFFPVLECGGLWLYKTISDLRCPLFCLLNSPPYFSFFLMSENASFFPFKSPRNALWCRLRVLPAGAELFIIASLAVCTYCQ